MMRDSRSRKRLYQTGAVLAAAALMKLLYSTANVNQLRWILAPTSFLVELATGERFRFESYAGYINDDHSFLIADSCSGVNFLIAAFLMLAMLVLWSGRHKDVAWPTFLVVAVAAYISTIAANTVRIAVALKVHRMNVNDVWINPEQMHRLQGIFIYFGFLLLLYLLYETINRNDRVEADRRSFFVRRPFVPLLTYWLITLGIPILRGAYQQGLSFWEHSAFVVVVPLTLITPFIVVPYLKRKRSSLISG